MRSRSPPIGWRSGRSSRSNAIHSRWAGLRTFTPDRHPAVGFAPDADGFFWLAGQGGFGLQTSPAMAADRGIADRRRAVADRRRRRGRAKPRPLPRATGIGRPNARRIRGSFADQVKRDLALGRVAAMLEQENALPGAEHQPAVLDRDRELGLRQARCAGARACRRALRRHARRRRLRARSARNRLRGRGARPEPHFPGSQRRRGVPAKKVRRPSRMPLSATKSRTSSVNS